MKIDKLSFLLIIFFLCSCGEKGVSENIQVVKTEKSETLNPIIKKIFNNPLRKRDEIAELRNKYSEEFYLACFSLYEIREIIPYDTLSYNNLIYLDSFTKKLRSDQKEEILINIINYKNNLSLNEREKFVILINNWIELNLFYKKLAIENFYSLDILMEVLYNNEMSKSLFDGWVDSEGYGLDGLSSFEMDAIYYESINKVAKWEKVDIKNFIDYLKDEKNWQ